MERNTAILTAFSRARKVYFKRFPQGLLPSWLGLTSRHAKDYLPDGSPSRVSQLERNPRTVTGTRAANVRRAKRLFEDFTEEEATIAETIDLPDFQIGLAPGRILGIIYETRIKGVPKKFIHEFRKVSSRPLLVVSHDGKQFRSLGGGFRFTDRGFIDE